MTCSALTAGLGLASCILIQPVGAQRPWHAEQAAWLERHTAAAANGVLGLTEPGWRADCKLTLDSRSTEQRSRVYALSAVRSVSPDAVETALITITFDPTAALGRVSVQVVLEGRERVIKEILAYASACGAALTSSQS